MGDIILDNKKNALRKTINECKGEHTINRYLDICSIHPDFKKSIDLNSDYFYLDKITIQKLVRNADPTLDKEVITKELYDLIEIENKGIEVLRGQIYWIDFGKNTIGSEQGGIRPGLVIQNNIGNKFSTTVVVIAITTQIKKANNIPAHVLIDTLEYETGLEHNSIVLTEQIRTVDKQRIVGYIGECPYGLMKKIEKAFKIEFGIDDPVDIVGFIEYFAQKRNASEKLKIAIAVDMRDYFMHKGIDCINNVDKYIDNLKHVYIKNNKLCETLVPVLN